MMTMEPVKMNNNNDDDYEDDYDDDYEDVVHVDRFQEVMVQF